MEKQLTPQLRFTEFEDEWNKKKLIDVAVFLDHKRKPIKSADRAKTQGVYPYYGASGIIDYINEYIFDDELVLLGEDGENILSRNLPLAYRVSGKCWINNHAHVLKPKAEVNIDFLTESLELVNYVIYNTGTAQPKLNKEVCKSIPLKLPSLPEQQKIASFLTDVDEVIIKLTKKKTLLEQYKKGIMQKIFNQELRFKDDNGNEFPVWEEKMLGEITKYYDGTHQTPNYVSEGVPFYSVEHVTANQFEKTKYISREVFEKENKRVRLEKGDILMTRIGNVGKARYIDWDVKASFYVSLALIKQNSSFSSKYLAQYINSVPFQRELWKRIIHVAFPIKINLGEIGKCLVQLPCVEEQNKIANFLSDIDLKIEALNTKIENSKSFKKGLLQQMFV
ncbi:restriction endonuclease subunit S [Mariniflexile sp. AS56]|uniref:restriction endonuclease subunit S n=1 Tax=Mariniflexile sp. AS56 TaxID=3063957 RepID=UPI0026EAE45F|nr:restriction endonuclease subunit S [Mariniflexile sp. AS56]MDO7174157.1 restriction endonuclease subunit S [Mariniflexile sp. AS56]